PPSPPPPPPALPPRRDQRPRRRQSPRHQHRCHLRLDQNRQTHRPPRSRQPALHPLDQPHRNPMPPPHQRVRAPQPRSPTHQTPHPNLTTPQTVGATRHHDTQPFHQHNTTPMERSQHAIAGGAV